MHTSRELHQMSKKCSTLDIKFCNCGFKSEKANMVISWYSWNTKWTNLFEEKRIFYCNLAGNTCPMRSIGTNKAIFIYISITLSWCVLLNNAIFSRFTLLYNVREKFMMWNYLRKSIVIPVISQWTSNNAILSRFTLLYNATV